MINFKKIKLVCFDCDGVLTDGMYQVDQDGKVSKNFYTRDFSGIECLLKNNIDVIIITRSNDGVILKRVHNIVDSNDFWLYKYKHKKLRVFNGIKNKKEYLRKILLDRGINWGNVAYMGDSYNDLDSMKEAYISGCPKDAIKEILDESFYISDCNGGKGAVYEFCKYLIEKGKK